MMDRRTPRHIVGQGGPAMLLNEAAGVIPAKLVPAIFKPGAGIQVLCGFPDPGLRRGDAESTTLGRPRAQEQACPSGYFIRP